MSMKIGQIETVGVAGRKDAFHVPAILVRALGAIRSGRPVRFTDDTFSCVIECNPGQHHAIADPFLSESVIERGALFWVLLVPGTVEGLTHQFGLNINDVPRIPQLEPEAEPEYEDECRNCY